MRKRKNRNNTNKNFSVLDNKKDGFEKPEDIIVGFKNRLKPRSVNQKEYIRTVAENVITFCQGVPGSGKALTLNSKLFTKNGPITMGEVKIGDEIANPDGSFSKVSAIYPQGKRQVFRVYFSNDTYVDCCEEHLWEIKHHREKNKIVVNTKYLMNNCRGHEDKRVLSIECTKPVNFDRKTYIIDPYLLGIIISEGNCTNGNVVFSTCESEILSKVGSLIDNNYTIKTKEKLDHRIVKKQRSSKNNIYKEELKILGLWGKYSYEKRIPEIYKYGSIDQRIALLQGLMDGDGTVTKKGSASYSTTSYGLAQDFCELVYSLGGTTRIRSKQGSLKTDGGRHRTSYRCHISLPNDISIFFLDRKKRKQTPRTKYFPKLYVDRVEKLGYKEMQCITVDHKNSLYLTDNYIPTHNTHIAVGMALEYLLDHKVKKVVITRPIVEAGEKLGFLPGPQPLDAKVLTPNGWSLMGDLNVGDEVISRDGKPTKVIGVYPKGKKDVYKITTTDGRSTECCLDHLWYTSTAEEQKRGKNGQVRSTKEILETLRNNKGKINHFLPFSEPAQLNKQQLPIHPYILGVLLGDGSFGNYIGFASNDQDLVDKMNLELNKTGYMVSKQGNRIAYNIKSINNYNNKVAQKVRITDVNTKIVSEYHSIGIAAKELKTTANFLRRKCALGLIRNNNKYEFIKTDQSFTNNIKDDISKLGLLYKKAWEKFIPDIYKYSNIEDRIEILRGLMDTDGTIREKIGESSFCTTSKRLALDVIELVRSLGGSANLRTRDRIGKTSIRPENQKKITARRVSYEFTIRLPNGINPFYLPRKSERIINGTSRRKIGIDKIEKICQKEVQCIKVNNPEHLYITDDFIVTHNTAEEKLHPYLLPLFDEINYFLSDRHRGKLQNTHQIEIVPLGLMRGRSFHNAFIIADECQNASYDQLKMLLTRIGIDSKMVLTGDLDQSDLQMYQKEGFRDIIQRLQQVKGIGFSELEISDIVRNPIIADIVNRL